MGRAAAVLLSDPVRGAGFPLCVCVHTYEACVWTRTLYATRNNSKAEGGFVFVTWGLEFPATNLAAFLDQGSHTQAQIE